ncbi:Serine/threonine protein kinase [Giardia duodenalis]|uniref:Serine/threonine protein kinase n=1 Tax=Giardia intestinalis TaxID=5741 RepID=V6THS9_GIAIN|nr:Serine/threonine protein kinase [Giardia intestinalis]
MHAASSGSATVASSVPQFTLNDLHERLGDILSKDITGIVYSLKDYPSLVVKVAPLGCLEKNNTDAVRLELAALPELSHPGVLRYHQVIEHMNFVYFITDRYNKTLGRLLIEHMQMKSPVPTRVILSAIRQIATALAYLHSVKRADAEGLVHRDLRSTNISISADGEHFIIAGLELCRNILWNGSTLIGTGAHTAPEALLRNEISPASDMWSLGVIIYELVTLRMLDFLEDREPEDVFVDEWRPDLSGVTDGFMKSILERIFVLEPERRPTARELHEMLDTADISDNEPEPWQVALESKHGSSKITASNTHAKIALLEEEVKTKLNEIATLKATLENRPSEVDALGQEPRIKLTRIDMLEDQCREYLAMIKVLDSRITQISIALGLSNSQFSLFLLPRFIRAARTNETETVRMLINEGVYIGQRDEKKMTALMHAAQQGHTGPIKLLVKEERGLQDKNGWTALMHAAHCNHPEAVKILAPYERGRRNKNSRTALMVAAENGSAEAASILGPYEDNLIDSEGNTALMIAEKAGHKLVAEILSPDEVDGCTALMQAAKCGRIDAVKLLIKNKSRAQNILGTTALMEAASWGHSEIVKLLIDHEGGMQDSSGMTALMSAIRNNQLECAKLLVERERDIKDKYDKTALDIAKAMVYPEMVSLLSSSVSSTGGHSDS